MMSLPENVWEIARIWIVYDDFASSAASTKRILHRGRLPANRLNYQGAAAALERLLARPGIPFATPLHGARDHDEAVAATAQWFGGFARQLPPLSACA
jgi:hypothetical protein